MNSMKHKPLIAFLLTTAILSTGFILAMKVLGQKGFYLGQIYMLVPAVAAIITRLFFYAERFRDAHLRLGRVRNYLHFYVITLGIVALTYMMYTAFSSVSWDMSGDTFLSQFAEQLSETGKDINDLPAGMTPKMMLLVFFIGGLTVFNIPFTIIAFGEEFGWRGLMFPQLYKIRPWVAFVAGGLIWFAWHVLLVFVYPKTQDFTLWENVLNTVILAGGTICTFVFLAYVYVKTESIWTASFAHAVFNNASRSFSYLATVENQLLANLALTITMALVIAVLYFRNELKVFRTHSLILQEASPEETHRM
jgi:membrane protease YdiL (CAAX protease family)